MDESDLYTDLFEDLEGGQSVIKTSFHELEERLLHLSNEGKEMRSQVEDLQSRNEKLQKQNEVLIRNISCLFKTAQIEIARKDKQIRGLQEENLKLTLNGSTAHPSANSRQLTAVARSKKEHEKLNAPAHTDLTTDYKNIDSSVCNGTFRKRVRSGDVWEALEDENCAAKEIGDERKPWNPEEIKREEREDIHCSRNVSHLTGTDAFRERRKEKWHHTHSNRRERGFHDGARVPRESLKPAFDCKSRRVSLDTENSGHTQSNRKERGSQCEERLPHDSLKPALESKTRESSLDKETSGRIERMSDHRGRRDDR